MTQWCQKQAGATCPPSSCDQTINLHPMGNGPNCTYVKTAKTEYNLHVGIKAILKVGLPMRGTRRDYVATQVPSPLLCFTSVIKGKDKRNQDTQSKRNPMQL